MGLDMYLWRYVNMPWDKSKMLLDITAEFIDEERGCRLPIRVNKVVAIKEEAMYWRKANHIHKWFVDNVQGGQDDCKPYWVSREALVTLLDICKEALAIEKNVLTEEDKEKLEELLPRERGFFFGGYEYDEWYFSDIRDTKDKLEELLKQDENCSIFVSYEYEASW